MSEQQPKNKVPVWVAYKFSNVPITGKRVCFSSNEPVIEDPYITSQNLVFRSDSSDRFGNISTTQFVLTCYFPALPAGLYMLTGNLQWSSPRKFESYHCKPAALLDLEPLGQDEISRVVATDAQTDFSTTISTYTVPFEADKPFSRVDFSYKYQMVVDGDAEYWNNVPQWSVFEDRLLTINWNLVGQFTSAMPAKDHDTGSLDSIEVIDCASDL